MQDYFDHTIHVKSPDMVQCQYMLFNTVYSFTCLRYSTFFTWLYYFYMKLSQYTNTATIQSTFWPEYVSLHQHLSISFLSDVRRKNSKCVQKCMTHSINKFVIKIVFWSIPFKAKIVWKIFIVLNKKYLFNDPDYVRHFWLYSTHQQQGNICSYSIIFMLLEKDLILGGFRIRFSRFLFFITRSGWRNYMYCI
jgi:hypothetical protein